MKRTFLVTSLLMFSIVVFAENNRGDIQIEPKEKTNEVFTKEAIEALQQWYNPETGLWRTTGWWNAANVLTGLIRYTAATGDTSYQWLIENTFLKTMKGGWDDRCGGGILWKKGLLYKSAISNELFLLLATRLSLRDENREYYLAWANKEWTWFSQTGMINDLPLVQDGVQEDCMAKGRHYTYNQGVILAGLVDLYQLDGNEEHLILANKIAMAAIQNMSTSEGILRGHPKQEDGADGVQFKGIFMRHLGYLYQHSKNDAFKEYLLDNAKSIQNLASKTGTSLIGSQWGAPFDKAGAGRQSSAIDALVSALEAEN